MPFATTVIIPTHNRRELLQRALASVQAQSILPNEIIVVDDGSTDGTADDFSRRSDRVRYIRQTNAGVSAARNTGIASASGEWLALLDSDDEWLPHKLERQIESLSRKPEMRICHSNEIWIRNGQRVNQMKKHQKYGGWIFRRCLPLCVISPSSVLIHRTVFEEIGDFDESLPACEDYDLWLRACARMPVLYIEEELIYKYGGHEDQLSRRHWGMDRFRCTALEKILKEGILDHADREAVLETLKAKLNILRSGAIKRGKLDDAKAYQERLIEVENSRHQHDNVE